MVSRSSSRARLIQIAEILVRYERILPVLVPALAVLAGLFVAGILIAFSGVSPLEAYAALFEGAFGSAYSTATSLNRATPLILAGLGVTFAFRAGIWNIGAEGQIYIGGLAATLVGLYLGSPAFIHLPLALIAGFLAGALWGGIAGYLRAKHGINEIIVTIMLNYVAIYMVGALVRGPIQEPPGFYPHTPLVDSTAYLPIILPNTRLHAGLIVALISAAVLFVLLWRSPIGYEIRAVGLNVKASRFAGMKVIWVQILSMLVSGGLAGLAGTSEILGAQYRLREFFLPNYGYDAIAVALLGQLDPIGVVIAGILFGALRAGAGTMQRMVNLPSSLVFVVQGTVVFFVVCAAILQILPRQIARKGSGHDD